MRVKVAMIFKTSEIIEHITEGRGVLGLELKLPVYMELKKTSSKAYMVNNCVNGRLVHIGYINTSKELF